MADPSPTGAEALVAAGESIVKSPWKDNQAEVAYDDMAVKTFEGGKGEDDENELQDDEPRASGSPADPQRRC